MKIHELIWPQDQIDHIAQHNITPAEVEEVCMGKPFIQRAKSQGENPVYYILGQTNAGRYLFCVVIRFADGRGYCTAYGFLDHSLNQDCVLPL